jgi:hypothetical protein
VWFRRVPTVTAELVLGAYMFVHYRCRNCGQSTKVFAISTEHHDDSDSFLAVKLGEQPVFGPPLPARLVSMIGPDRDLFLKGRRAELRGLGIGAFAYYRRVVENQSQRLFSELERAAAALNDQPAVTLLRAAAAETRFSDAVSMVKDGIPQRLWIEGHNPLTLLHNALSNDLHAGDDDGCLEVAASIREVLSELGSRISEISRENDGLRKAVSALAARPRKRLRSANDPGPD